MTVVNLHRYRSVRRPLAALACAACCVALAACGTTTSNTSSSGGSTASTSAGTTKGPLKVAFIYASPVNDHGWAQTFDASRVALQQHFAGKIVTTYKDNVPETSQVTQVIDSFIQQGYKVIVSTEYGYIPYVTAAAKANPSVKFLQVQGSQTASNLSVFNGDSSQAYYLAGMALAAASKTNTIGWLGGFAIPALIGNIDATELGAQAINPHAQVRAVYINTWEDPAKEEQASLALLSAGAGALTHDESDPTSGQVAEQHHIPWAGSQADQSQFAPTETVTSTLFNWEPYLATQISAILAGTWKPSAYFGGATNGTVGIPPMTSVATKLIGAANVAKIKAKEAALRSGTFHVFSGPLTDNKGKQMLSSGQTLSSSQIQSITWYVKGVQASGATT